MTHTRPKMPVEGTTLASQLHNQADAIKVALLGKTAGYDEIQLKDVSSSDQQQAPAPVAGPMQPPAIVTATGAQGAVVMSAPAFPVIMARPPSLEEGLPVHHTTTTIRPHGQDGALGQAHAAIRYAARVIRAVPKWVVRRSRPILSRVSARINVHRSRIAASLPSWAPSSSSGSQPTLAGASMNRLRGAVRALRNTSARLGRGVTRVMPGELLASLHESGAVMTRTTRSALGRLLPSSSASSSAQAEPVMEV